MDDFDSVGEFNVAEDAPHFIQVDGSVTLLQRLQHTCVPLPREGSTEALMNLMGVVVGAAEPATSTSVVTSTGWWCNSSTSTGLAIRVAGQNSYKLKFLQVVVSGVSVTINTWSRSRK